MIPMGSCFLAYFNRNHGAYGWICFDVSTVCLGGAWNLGVSGSQLYFLTIIDDYK